MLNLIAINLLNWELLSRFSDGGQCAVSFRFSRLSGFRLSGLSAFSKLKSYFRVLPREDTSIESPVSPVFSLCLVKFRNDEKRIFRDKRWIANKKVAILKKFR